MERAAWTEERLDDLAEAMRAGFASVDQRMDSGFARVDQDIRELRGDINGLRLMIMTFGAGTVIALIGVIAAVLVRGA